MSSSSGPQPHAGPGQQRSGSQRSSRGGGGRGRGRGGSSRGAYGGAGGGPSRPTTAHGDQQQQTRDASGPVRGTGNWRGNNRHDPRRNGSGRPQQNGFANAGAAAPAPAQQVQYQELTQEVSVSETPSDVEPNVPRVRFDSLLAGGLLSAATLRSVKHEFMTSVQAATLTDILLGNDCLAQAKTGTGKTVAFLLPSIELLRKQGMAPGVNILIISPTRELAYQIGEQAQELVAHDHGKIGVQTIVGGTNMNADKTKMKNHPCHILVATPGRLLDHLQNGDLKDRCANLKALILDEADRLLEQGFRQDIEKALTFLPDKATVPRQTLLFSATMPAAVKQIATLALNKNYKFISTISKADAATHTHVAQHVLEAPLSHSMATTFALIHSLHAAGKSKLIVFLPTARATQLYCETFHNLMSNLPAFEIHSRKSQSNRTKTTEAFKSAAQGVLFSSDVTARGIDIPDISAVIQTGLPMSREQYIHRLGRTARAGKQGEGYLILTPFEMFFADRKLTDMNLIRSALPNDTLIHTQTAVNNALQRVPAQTKNQAYGAWLGYYKGYLKDFKWSPRELVAAANQMARDMGCTELPPMLAKTVGKMGLKGVPGLNIVQFLPDGDA
ncbi:P-loop containing nucleoside triphosphate hydrolase protein [Powellomyces hirtus]|nr:P-loop containing nucleoside triphosphate hydrolase protein [Powellomyces hirtus]